MVDRQIQRTLRDSGMHTVWTPVSTFYRYPDKMPLDKMPTEKNANGGNV